MFSMGQDYRRNWEVEPEKTKRKRKNDIFQVFRGNAIAKHMLGQ
jgi:hypothetical protein